MAKRRKGNKTAPRGAAPATRVAYLIGRLDRVLRRRIGEVTAPFGLSVPQYTALSVLHARGQLSNAELARRTFMTPQAMGELVQALEARNLLARRPDPVHGRIVQIYLTRTGEELLRKCDTAVRQLEDLMLERLSPEERAKLQAHLKTCIHSLDVSVT